MALPEQDAHFLAERCRDALVVVEDGMTAVVLPHFPLPPGLSSGEADLLLRLSPSYPDVPPDMWWFSPPIRRADNEPIPATEVYERHLDKIWQRWSRHLLPGQWRSGVDSLESYVSLIRHQLLQAAAEWPSRGEANGDSRDG